MVVNLYNIYHKYCVGKLGFAALEMGDAKFRQHIVAIPFPSRGHINPLMNLCKLISMAKPQFLITFVVTEEWQGFLSSDPNPFNLRFGSIPNVLPSELIRSKDYPGFLRAAFTDMEAPVDRLLDAVEAPPEISVIIADVILPWVLGLGNRRNIPVAYLWCPSPTVFSDSLHNHQQLFLENRHLDSNFSEKREEVEGTVSSMHIKDLPPLIDGKFPSKDVRSLLLGAVSAAQGAQYLLFTSVAELESAAIEALRAKLQTPIYSIGPAIPYFYNYRTQTFPDYLAWLDAQPACSVLYISQGSFLSLSDEQLDEIIAGVHESGVRFFWVAREKTEWLKERCVGGFIVSWCDQLRVLCHGSIGGFWWHCGWNSVKEGAFAGVPFLTYPLAFDQISNSKMIVEDWKIGWSVKKKGCDDGIVRRGEIAQLLRRFMDPKCDESEELRRKAKEIGEMCRQSIEGGLAKHDLETFIEDISTSCNG